LFVAFPSDMKMASAAIEQVPREKPPPPPQKWAWLLRIRVVSTECTM